MNIEENMRKKKRDNREKYRQELFQIGKTTMSWKAAAQFLYDT